MDDKESNRAPLAESTHERAAQLNAHFASLTPPMPEVEDEVSKVARTEMMSPVPSSKDKVTPWKPGA